MPTDANVVMPDAPIPATGGQDVLIPRQARDLLLVSGHRAELLARLDIPKLDVSGPAPHTKEHAVLGERHAADVRVLWRLAQLHDSGRIGIPEVRAIV